MHRRHYHPEVGAHHGAGVDDVLQQIIEIVATRAGQVGTDFATNAGYWYSRAGRTMQAGSTQEEGAAIAGTLLQAGGAGKA